MKTYNNKPRHLIEMIFVPFVMMVFFIMACVDNDPSFNGPSESNKPKGLSEVVVTGIKPAGSTSENDKSSQINSGDPVLGEEIVSVRYPFDTLKVYTVVDTPPVPIGGLSEFLKLIAINLKYPAQARQRGIEGQVLVGFIVDQLGEIRNIHILKSLDPACDEEVMRVISLSPAWQPGINEGEAVPVKLVLPVVFNLEDMKEIKPR